MNKTDFEESKDTVLSLMKEGYGRYRIAKKLDIHPSKARRWMQKILDSMDESEAAALKESAKLSKSKQKLMDKNRIREKVMREHFRVENAVGEYNKELIDIFTKHSLHSQTINHSTTGKGAVGIIHISDTHFNELINIKDVNSYDFNIASKRLYLLAERAKKYFQIMDVENVLIAMTGDLMNSDRRLDELLSMATNRSQATFVAVDLLQQFILDINGVFNVHVACVTGNESRIPNDIGWSEIVATDNYDVTIFNILKYLFKDSEGVIFIEGTKGELVVKAGDVNVLMLHGHGSIKRDIEKSVGQIVGRYANRGQIIDYVIFGHLHSASIGDKYSRCASLAGANAYSEEKLNLSGRASQNLYVIHNNKLIDGMKVDLQITEGKQYVIDESIQAYNCKSEDKLKHKTTVFEIVI